MTLDTINARIHTATIHPEFNDKALRLANARYAKLVREFAAKYPTLEHARADGQRAYLSSNNKKLAPDRIAAWNLVALANCHSFAACGRICYATSNMFCWPDAVRVRWCNYLESLSPGFAPVVAEKIAALPKTWQTVRIHDSGDFYNHRYVTNWIAVVESFPALQFYAYTKEHHRLSATLDELGTLPNMTLIQSAGGRDDDRIDTTKPHSRIFPDLDALLAAGYEDCSHSDKAAAYGEVNNVGLIVHGQRGTENYNPARFTEPGK